MENPQNLQFKKKSNQNNQDKIINYYNSCKPVFLWPKIPLEANCNIVWIVLSSRQHLANLGPEQGPGSECVQGAGDDSAVFTFPGTAAPLPAALHPVPAGAVGLPERLHQVDRPLVQNTWTPCTFDDNRQSFCVLFSYFSQLSDSGQKLGEEVRRSYHQLVLMLVEAVQGFSSLNEK